MPYVSPYNQWANGPTKSQNYFPIFGWVQQTANATALAGLGLNGLMSTSNDNLLSATDLSRLAAAGMSLISHRTSAATALSGDPNFNVIVGWNPGPDEPDNSQPGTSGFQGFILPATQIATYQALVAADSTRPAVMNLGQGVADVIWIGHGFGQPNNTGGGFIQDYYYQYTQATDICLFDVYPVANWNGAVADHTNLLFHHYISTKRFVTYSAGKKPVWRHLECSYIHNTASPRARIATWLLKSQIWLNIIAGANGLVYFMHEWQPAGAFTTDCVLLQSGNPVWTSEGYASYASAITKYNKEVTSLAHVINTPEENGLVTEATTTQGGSSGFSGESGVSGFAGTTPVVYSCRKIGHTAYVFTAGLFDIPNTNATFTVPGLHAGTQVHVLNENRNITSDSGGFSDNFGNPYSVHLYSFTIGA